MTYGGLANPLPIGDWSTHYLWGLANPLPMGAGQPITYGGWPTHYL